MRKICLLFAAFFLLYACKKDEESGPENYLKYNDVTYELNKGYLEYYGDYGGVYNFDLTVASSSITISEDGASGVGNIAYFEMFSSSSTDLAAGTYTFSATSMNANTFDEGLVGLDFDLANEVGTSLELVGGTIEVTKTGSTYEITISGVLATGKTVTGKYKGTLIYYDYSS
jgi:hypothetical protein